MWDEEQYQLNVELGVLPKGGRIFGGSAECRAQDDAGNAIPGAPGFAYGDPDDEAPIPVWINPDSPDPQQVTTLHADERGVCPVFVGPDGLAPVWVDFGYGRVALSPWDTDRRMESYHAALEAAKVDRISSTSEDPGAPLLLHNRDYPPTADGTPIAEFQVQGTPTAWLTGWGAYRAVIPLGTDSAIRVQKHAQQTRPPVEIQNPDGRVIWGVDPDGFILQGNGTSMPVRTSPVLVLGPSDPVPSGTPAGTVILRRES